MDQDEKRAAERFGIRLIDAGNRAREQVPAKDFGKVVQALHDAEEPILIHCANGNDRSGLASALYLLLRTDASLNDARQQFHLLRPYPHRQSSVPATNPRQLRNLAQGEGLAAQSRSSLILGHNVYEPEQLP